MRLLNFLIRSRAGEICLKLWIFFSAKIAGRIGHDVEFFGQAVDLVCIKDVVAFGERDAGFAKYLGAFVATTVSARNADLVTSLGADVVIDYGR